MCVVAEWGRETREEEEKEDERGGLEVYKIPKCWDCAGPSQNIHLRFSAELAAVERVNLQQYFLAMTPISAMICGRQQLAALGCASVQCRLEQSHPASCSRAAIQWRSRPILRAQSQSEVLAMLCQLAGGSSAGYAFRNF